LIANPTTQAQKDQNLIVNYAIDKGLGVQRTASGMYYQIVEEGEGEHPTQGGKVTVHYEGQMLDGKVFDSSYRNGAPLTFSLGQVIRGWQEAIPMLRPGGKAMFLIPSELAYGPVGYPGMIPPNSVLRFDVELIK